MSRCGEFIAPAPAGARRRSPLRCHRGPGHRRPHGPRPGPAPSSGGAASRPRLPGPAPHDHVVHIRDDVFAAPEAATRSPGSPAAAGSATGWKPAPSAFPTAARSRSAQFVGSRAAARGITGVTRSTWAPRAAGKGVRDAHGLPVTELVEHHDRVTCRAPFPRRTAHGVQRPARGQVHRRPPRCARRAAVKGAGTAPVATTVAVRPQQRRCSPLASPRSPERTSTPAAARQLLQVIHDLGQLGTVGGRTGRVTDLAASPRPRSSSRITSCRAPAATARHSASRPGRHEAATAAVGRQSRETLRPRTFPAHNPGYGCSESLRHGVRLVTSSSSRADAGPDFLDAPRGGFEQDRDRRSGPRPSLPPRNCR